MTVNSPWFYGFLALIVIAVIAWPATLLIYDMRGRQAPGRGGVSSDRWASGGMFRGDPRAVSRRDEVPGPRDLPSSDELGSEDVLPPEPGELAQRRRSQPGRAE